MWRTRDDDKVRQSHRDNDDTLFRWDTPPPTGHPGTDYGCRCYAEPYVDIPYRGQPDEPLEPLYPEYYLIPAGAALRSIRLIVDTIGERVQRWQREHTITRGKKAPKGGRKGIQ